MATILFTVGHSVRPLAVLIEILRAHGIEQVVDVRSYPRSRRHPHFNTEALAASLPREGIAYRGLRGLGGHRRPRPDSSNLGLRRGGFRGYADHMETTAFHEALQELLGLGERRPTAVLCAEADWRRCHRQFLADALLVQGARVVHILDAERTEPHRLTRHARVAEGKLSYPKPQPSLF